MAGPALAKTTFVSGADDSLRVKDVYGEGGGIVNSYTEDHPDNIDILVSVDSSAGGGSNNQDDDPIATDSGLDDAPDVGTIGGALEGAGDENDELADLLASLDEDMLNDIPLDEATLDGTMCSVNGMDAYIKGNVSGKSLKTLGAMINQLACDGYNLVVNSLNAIASLIAGIASLASRLGLPGAFSSIANCAGNQPSVLGNAVRIMAPQIAAKGNIPLLNDVARSGFGGALNNALPGVVNRTISNLGLPSGLAQSAYSGYYNNARESFGRVDSGWNTTNFGGNEVLQGTVVSGNDFFRDTMGASVNDRNISVRPENGEVVTYQNYGADSNGIVASEKRPGETDPLYQSRVGIERQRDTFIYGASGFGKQTVDGFINKAFSNVGAKLGNMIRN
jgi:hypothetical protein